MSVLVLDGRRFAPPVPSDYPVLCFTLCSFVFSGIRLSSWEHEQHQPRLSTGSLQHCWCWGVQCVCRGPVQQPNSPERRMRRCLPRRPRVSLGVLPSVTVHRGYIFRRGGCRRVWSMRGIPWLLLPCRVHERGWCGVPRRAEECRGLRRVPLPPWSRRAFGSRRGWCRGWCRSRCSPCTGGEVCVGPQQEAEASACRCG